MLPINLGSFYMKVLPKASQGIERRRTITKCFCKTIIYYQNCVISD